MVGAARVMMSSGTNQMQTHLVSALPSEWTQTLLCKMGSPRQHTAWKPWFHTKGVLTWSKAQPDLYTGDSTNCGMQLSSFANLSIFRKYVEIDIHRDYQLKTDFSKPFVRGFVIVLFCKGSVNDASAFILQLCMHSFLSSVLSGFQIWPTRKVL